MPIFPSNEPEKEYTAVLWTEGSKFHYIESSSLLHILQFEKVSLSSIKSTCDDRIEFDRRNLGRKTIPMSFSQITMAMTAGLW